MPLGLNKVTDPNFLVPVLVVALLAIYLSRKVDFVARVVNS